MSSAPPNKQELAVTDATEVQKIENYNPASLLSQAIEKGLDVDTLERLMGLQERWEDRQAEKKFYQALSDFQEEMPEIRKTKEVRYKDTDVKPTYTYAPLPSIIRQIKGLLKKHGFSYRYRIKDEGDKIKVTCLLSHTGGHTADDAEMSSSPDKSGGKNDIQSRGSAIEYMKRYTLEGALGISTADTDNDGKTTEYEYDIDKLHKTYMEVYNQVLPFNETKYSQMHPDNWLIERTGRNYVKAIGDIRKILFDLQQKEKKQ